MWDKTHSFNLDEATVHEPLDVPGTVVHDGVPFPTTGPWGAAQSCQFAHKKTVVLKYQLCCLGAAG